MGSECERRRPPKRVFARVAAQDSERTRLRAAARFGVSPLVFDGWAPTETHEHYDAHGNLTGTTTVTRTSEWDDTARAEAFALLAYEANQCPNCRNYDCLVPLPKDTRHVTWDEHDGRRIEVVQYRCLACGATDLIRRDWNERHAKDQHLTGQASPSDGRIFIAHPISESEEA